jgi:UDP-N-acetylglucosamine 4-epimerase
MLALFTNNTAAANQVYNIACGEQTSLNQLFEILKLHAGVELSAIHGTARQGDVLHSLADISKAKKLLGYEPSVSVKEGLKKAFEWYQTHQHFLN